MKILVTGGAGFIGSNIVDQYILDGNEVIIVDNLKSGNLKNINKSAKYFQFDIRSEEVTNLIINEKPDVINHHAAHISVRESVDDPIYNEDVNIKGSINILEAAIKAKVKKIIFASTGGAIYGEQQNFPADEHHPVNPISPYGISKLAVEKYLNYYYQVHNLNFTILRYANVYGPRQDPFGEAGVVAIFISKMIKNEIPIVNGDGLQTRDYVYVKDVVKANCNALHLGFNDYFNIGTSKETNVVELFGNLKKIIGFENEAKYGPAQKGEQLRSVLNISKAKDVLNWCPEADFTNGLSATINYFKGF